MRPFWIPESTECRAYRAGLPRPKRSWHSRRQPETKQSRYRDRLCAEGRCPKCGHPAAPFYYCTRHLESLRRRYYKCRVMSESRAVIPAPKRGIAILAPEPRPGTCMGTLRGPCGWVLRTLEALARGRCDDCWAEAGAGRERRTVA